MQIYCFYGVYVWLNFLTHTNIWNPGDFSFKIQICRRKFFRRKSDFYVVVRFPRADYLPAPGDLCIHSAGFRALLCKMTLNQYTGHWGLGLNLRVVFSKDLSEGLSAPSHSLTLLLPTIKPDFILSLCILFSTVVENGSWRQDDAPLTSPSTPPHRDAHLGALGSGLQK